MMRMKVAQYGSKETVANEQARSQPLSTAPAWEQRGMVASVLKLQRTYGNRAVQRMLRPEMIQAKLSVNSPGDEYEEEADRVAAMVMRAPDPGAEAGNRISNVKRKDRLLRTAATGGRVLGVSSKVESGIQTLRGGGQPLSEPVRSFFEPRFQQDFSHVRIHTDNRAARLARSMDALAFTIGEDVVFGAGQYDPNTTEGMELLAHELTHVVQQSCQTTTTAGAQRCPVKHHLPTPRIQGTWRLSDTKNSSDDNTTTSGHGEATTACLARGGVFGKARAWQEKPAYQWCIDGGTASLFIWCARQYTFKHDGKDNNFLEFTVSGDLDGGAKAEDKHYAKAGAAVVAIMKVRTPASPTPAPKQLFVIKDGGKSTAVVSTIADIEATIPIDGTITVKIPLKWTSEGTLAAFSESLTPPVSHDVAGTVGSETFVDVYLAARVEAAADVESTCIPEEMDTNWAHATARYNLLRWADRVAPGTVSPAPEERGPAIQGGGGGTPPGCAPRSGDLFRSMKRDGDQPYVEQTARGLGVRMPADIKDDPPGSGQVHPNTGGMSTAPNDPANLQSHRLPKACGGTSPDSLFAIPESTIKSAAGLDYRRDSSKHGTVMPKTSMHIDTFRDHLARTKSGWILVVRA